jgi:hypothetical protein
MPEHKLDPPVPVVARIVWEDDGEEFIETVAAGWTGSSSTFGCRIGGIGSRRCGSTRRTSSGGDCSTPTARILTGCGPFRKHD